MVLQVLGPLDGVRECALGWLAPVPVLNLLGGMLVVKFYEIRI